MSSSQDETATSLAGAEAYCPTCNDSFDASATVCPKDGSRLIQFREQVDPMIGRILDERFEVRSRLGRGGMGTVYKAWQRSVDREVAIKVIDPRLSHDRNAAKRFLREARLASRLSEPNIVNIYDFGQTDDEILYLAMELLRGRTLAQKHTLGERMEVRRVVAIAVQLCDALEAAHRQGIIHRDLKPQNIVVLEGAGRDLVKVLDFGLAKSLIAEGTAITHSDALLGTPLYMAPEVIGGRPAGPGSDLYSLGCIVYELLAGKSAFFAKTANAVLAKHLTEEPPPLPESVPPELSALVRELLRKDPGQRPESAATVRARLLAVPASEAVPAPSSSRSARSEPIALAETIQSAPTGLATRRSGRRFALVLGALVIAVGALVAVVLSRRHEPASPQEARPAGFDAAPAPRAEVIPDATPPDATPPDAAPPDAAPPPDAPRKKPPRSPKPPKPDTSSKPDPSSEPAQPNAEPAEPDVDFIPVGPDTP